MGQNIALRFVNRNATVDIFYFRTFLWCELYTTTELYVVVGFLSSYHVSSFFCHITASIAYVRTIVPECGSVLQHANKHRMRVPRVRISAKRCFRQMIPFGLYSQHESDKLLLSHAVHQQRLCTLHAKTPPLRIEKRGLLVIFYGKQQ